MKATYIKQQGDIDVLICGDLPEPTVNSDEVLIRIGASALNHLDVFARAVPTADRSRDLRPDGMAYPSATPALDMDDSAHKVCSNNHR